MATARHYKVILLDLKLPGMDGMTTLERIRALDPNVRVIVVSGLQLEKPVVQGLRRSAYTVLTKPRLVGEELLALIRPITDRAKTHDLSKRPGQYPGCLGNARFIGGG